MIELQVSGWAIGCFQRFVCAGGKVAKPAATIWTNLSKLIVLVAELILWNQERFLFLSDQRPIIALSVCKSMLVVNFAQIVGQAGSTRVCLKSVVL